MSALRAVGRSALRAFAGLALCAALNACVTPPPVAEWTPVAADDAGAREGLAWLRAHAAARRSLRANARVELAGAAGESFSKQLVLAERDAKLRIEVVGVLNQRVLVLASDGATYDVYRADAGKVETGPVEAGVLWRVARIPLLPSEAVGLLLAAPAIPEEAPRAERNAAGELRFSWADRGVTLDAAGAFREARVLSPQNGQELAVARFEDWRGEGASAFPYRIELDFISYKGGATLEIRDAEVNPTLDSSWFRLKASAQ
jgi:hypothetical protein